MIDSNSLALILEFVRNGSRINMDTVFTVPNNSKGENMENIRFYYPSEIEPKQIKKRGLYVYQYTINGKVKKAGFTTGAKMVNMHQYRASNEGTKEALKSEKLFEFREVFSKK